MPSPEAMRTLFIPAKSTTPVDVPREVLEKLPSRVALVTTVQHHHCLPDVRRRLEGMGRAVQDIHGSHSTLANQVLGCNTFPAEQLSKVDAIFYIGSGEFNPKALALRTGKPVHMYHPVTGEYSVLSSEEVERLRKRERGALARFLSAKHVGLLFTTKPGQFPIQMQLRQLGALEKRYPEKEFHVLVDNSFNYAALENFPFIEVFLNTACPNIAYDPGLPRPVLNVEQVLVQ